MLNNIKKAWRVLWGEDLGPLGTFYPRNKMIQLFYYEGRVLALTDGGGIVELRMDYSGQMCSIHDLLVP